MSNHLVTCWQRIDGWVRWTFLGLAAPILAIGLLYWGYCWHWWGRDSLLLQYLFQCRCPAASEAVRYPNLNILASACAKPRVHTMSPNGALLLFDKQIPAYHVDYLELPSQQQNTVSSIATPNNTMTFLNEELLFVQFPLFQGIIVELQTDSTVETAWFSRNEEDAFILQQLQRTETVFIVDNLIIGITYNQGSRQRKNMVWYDNSRSIDQRTQQLMQAGITFEEVQPPYQTGPVYGARYAPDGRFYALHDGVYDATTNERLLDTDLPMFDAVEGYRAVGWVIGQRSIVYAAGTPYLFDNRDDLLFPYTWFPVHQPVLLLELPEEFWTELEEEP